MALNHRIGALEDKQRHTDSIKNTHAIGNRYGVLVTQYLNAKYAGNKERMIEIKAEMVKELERNNAS